MLGLRALLTKDAQAAALYASEPAVLSLGVVAHTAVPYQRACISDFPIAYNNSKLHS